MCEASSAVVGFGRMAKMGEFELVERKGLGHPDTMADAISEEISRAYAMFCLDAFGGIAHHWFDKVIVVGGEADVAFGAGRILKPYRIIVCGKCAFSVGASPIPLLSICQAAVERVLDRVLTGASAADFELELRVVDSTGPGRPQSRYRPTDVADLVRLETVASGRSNDANLVSSYAPLSALEQVVLDVEGFLNSSEFKLQNPDVGWDVKVLGRRHGHSADLTVNVPLLAGHIRSIELYSRRIADILEALRLLVQESSLECSLTVNPADRGGPYLLARGSVADTGDVGVTGRGNRSNGLITPMRPMSIEAAAGKNPADHTGKIYSVLANRVAGGVAELLSDSCEIHISTVKDRPLTAPDIYIATGTEIGQLSKARIEEFIGQELDRLPQLVEQIIRGELGELW